MNKLEKKSVTEKRFPLFGVTKYRFDGMLSGGKLMKRSQVVTLI
jgi:hypothetical protein